MCHFLFHMIIMTKPIMCWVVTDAWGVEEIDTAREKGGLDDEDMNAEARGDEDEEGGWDMEVRKNLFHLYFENHSRYT